MMKFLEHKYTFWCILAVAFLLRLLPLLCAVSDGERLLRPDSLGYLNPAMSLAENGSYNTSRRPPGYPLLAAAVYHCGGGNTAIAVIQLLLATATCIPVYMTGKIYASRKCGNIAALLMALNLTAIANTPLLLSDTMFAFFIAWQFYFFIRYCQTNKLHDILLTTLIAAAAVLIRPINQLFILVLAVLILSQRKISWKTRLIHIGSAAMLFAAIIVPWMFRNFYIGADFDIDSNTGAMRHQNGAMLMAEINGTDFESEKRKLLEYEAAVFSDKEKFPDERSREKWRKAEFRSMVMKYPFTYLSQHFDLNILLPDAPTMLENFGVTTSDRGTMGVLKKDGLFAAIKHYFGRNYLLYLLILLPLLLPTIILYFAVICRTVKYVRHLKSDWFDLLILLGFAEYYLFLPGAITAPRYQLPALPCLCTVAALTISSLLSQKNAAENKKSICRTM